MTKNKAKDLLKLFDGNENNALFYVTWIKHNHNATKAYQELHPNCTYESAMVGGSRMLRNIKTETIMAAYGLNKESYFTQLKEALGATKWNDFTGEREADHKTRQAYHDKLGKLLGIETDKPLIQFNEMKMEVIQDAEKTE